MKRIWMLALGLTAALALALSGCGSAGSNDGSAKSEADGTAPTVAAPAGTYTGQMHDGVEEFLGIRYAAPAQRWKAPQDVTTTTDDAIDATNWGPCCTQPYSEVEVASQGDLSEDCLNLNIWTKNSETQGKPVMVYIHGGGYMNGGAHDPMYEGDTMVRNLPADEDMVFVSINYRTNLFGHLDLSQLEGYTDEYQDAVNLWLLDEIQALKWVNENISAFGGDTDNITVSGQSCGGMSITFLLSKPETHQYFQKAIIESGAPFVSQITRQANREITEMACDIFGVKTLDDFLALSDQDIKDNGLDEFFENLSGQCGIYADGRIVPKGWWDDIRNGSAKDVKVMIGCTNGENDFAGYDFEKLPQTVSDPQEIWDNYIAPISEENGGEAARYFINPCLDDGTPAFDLAAFQKTDADPVKAMVDLVNDMYYVQGTEYEAEAFSQYTDTYLYRFDYAPDPDEVADYCEANGLEPETSPYGRALHSMGALFALGNMTDGYPELSGDPAKLPPELSPMTQSAWYHFVKDGDPNNDLIPAWKPYDTKDRWTMLMDETWKLAKDPRKAQREIFSVRPQGEED